MQRFRRACAKWGVEAGLGGQRLRWHFRGGSSAFESALRGRPAGGSGLGREGRRVGACSEAREALGRGGCRAAACGGESKGRRAGVRVQGGRLDAFTSSSSSSDSTSLDTMSMVFFCLKAGFRLRMKNVWKRLHASMQNSQKTRIASGWCL